MLAAGTRGGMDEEVAPPLPATASCVDLEPGAAAAAAVDWLDCSCACAWGNGADAPQSEGEWRSGHPGSLHHEQPRGG